MTELSNKSRLSDFLNALHKGMEFLFEGEKYVCTAVNFTSKSVTIRPFDKKSGHHKEIALTS